MHHRAVITAMMLAAGWASQSPVSPPNIGNRTMNGRMNRICRDMLRKIDILARPMDWK